MLKSPTSMDESPSRLPMPSQLPKKDGAKRRSLLLPPGTISGAARKGVLSPTDEEPPARVRPMTMFGLPRPLPSPREEESERLKEEAEDSRSPSPESKEMAREVAHAALMGATSSAQPGKASVAPKSGIARSTSMRAPATRSAASKAADLGRSRIAGTRPLSMLKESTSRPQSVASTASKLSGPETAAPSRLKAPAPSTSTTTGLRRSNTTTASTSRHSRTQSALPPSAHPQSTTTAPPRRHPTISEGTSETKLHRPAFSTLQQHYSPKKNLAPKPASSSLIHSAPSADSATPSSSLETQLQQARLQHLSLLHRSAESTYRAWTASARRALKHKFTDVAAECGIVQQREKDTRRRANAAALKAWCGGDMGLLGEQISTLSSVLTEVMSLIEDGGRVFQALEAFEAWITWVEAVYCGRDSRGSLSVEFVEGLGEAWRVEVGVLVRKLQGLARQLDGLGDVEGESSLKEIVEGMRELVRGAVEELRAVEGLEGSVVRREASWVDEQIGGVMGEIDGLLA